MSCTALEQLQGWCWRRWERATGLESCVAPVEAPSLAALRSEGSRAVMVQLLREAGRAGELSRESQAGQERGRAAPCTPRSSPGCVMQSSTGGRTLDPPPRADPGSSLEHGARTSTSSTAGTYQLSPRGATHGGEPAHPALPTFTPHLTHPLAGAVFTPRHGLCEGWEEAG